MDDVRGSVALERGPLVYALEGLDGDGLDLDLVTIDTAVAPRDTAADTGIPEIVPVEVTARMRATPEGEPYGASPTGAPGDEARTLVTIPYFRWANRGPSTMRVWTPRTDVALAEAAR